MKVKLEQNFGSGMRQVAISATCLFQITLIKPNPKSLFLSENNDCFIKSQFYFQNSYV